MSQRCPKQNHLFLNWLKTNRSLFPFEPRITRISKLHMSGYFVGISRAVRFHIYRGSHIDVTVCLNGQLWGYIGEFLFWEKHCKKGYYADWLDPESYHYYSSRPELWIEECFEPFLSWCNETLATHKWLALYSEADENGEYTITRLQNSETPTVNMTLTKLLQVQQANPFRAQ